MNPDVLQFQCSACQSVLTVPSHMAGVTGPCPICGQTITSPSANPAAAPASLFTTPSPQASPQQAPSQQPLPQQVPPATPGQVMPMPNSIAQHLGPRGNPMPPAGGGGFLGGTGSPPGQPTPEQPAAPWHQPHQPGLGQTLLGGMPPQQQPMTSGLGLPPRRPEGSPPQSAAVQQPMAPWGGTPASPPTASSQPQIGSPLFPQRTGAGAPSHSSLIPGSPTLPTLGTPGGAEMPQNSLLSRDIPSTAPAPPLNLPETRKEGSSTPSYQTRPLKRPKRSSNIFMFALAVLFLAGFLAAAGWMFREPIMEVVNRFMPPAEEEVAIAPISEPQTISTPQITPPEVTEPPPDVPIETEAPKTLAFDPEQPKPPRAETPTAEELANLQSPLSASVTPPPSSNLLESPPKSMTAALQNGSTGPDSNLVSEPKPHELKIEVTEEAKPAAEALMQFLTAKDLETRLRYTLAVDSMKPLMERYYQSQPSGPVRVDAVGLVRFDRKPQVGGGAHAVFGVESRTWEYPVPVMLEETKEGFKVDWLSFVEFKDRILEKFFEGYQEGPARFHVGITRTHYFEDKVPNSDNKDAFRIGPAPPNPYLNTVFVEKDTQVGRDLRDRIPWGAQVWAIVELEWVKLGTQQWVQLVGVPQLNWYSVPAEKNTKGGKSSDLPNEVQRAVPVGR